MDLCGFMPTKSLEGNKYVYVLLDEYSRDTWVYVMKRKVFGYFVEFMERVQNEIDKRIKKVKSNNREFVKLSLHTYLKKKGT